MEIRYLINVLIGMVVACACQDNDDSEIVNPRPEHQMRVSEIAGYNSHWKDYTLKISYMNDKVTDVERFNAHGRKVGGLEIERNQESVYYYLYDYVPAIDSDSIARLDAHLAELYGEGTYSLEDSIPLTEATLMILMTEMEEGRISAQQFTYYQPKTDFGVGADFSPNYDAKSRESYIYEYGNDNSIIICRNLSDVFSEGNEDIYERESYKIEYAFNGQQVQNRILSVAGIDYEDNWNVLQELSYAYSAGRLIEIAGNNYSLQCVYNNEKLTSITENGETTLYTMNEQGYCTRIEYASGDYMDIKYENGSGDFNIFTRLDRPQQGYPIIW